MSAAPIEQATVAAGIASRWGAGMVGLLLAASVGGQVGVTLAAAAPVDSSCRNQDEGCGDAPPLERLSATIDDLRARLSALREDLEARRGEGEDGDQAIVDELCAMPLAEVGAARDAAMSALEQFRGTMASERAAARAAAAAASDELSALREQLASAEAEVARLIDDRATLIGHIEELDAAMANSRTIEVVAGSGESRPTAPNDAAHPGQPDAAPERQLMLQVAQPGPAALGSPESGGRASGQRPAPHVDRLQLRAELALAQLKIAELTTALESARLRQEGMEAEVSTLRSLTDAKIRQLMGWQ